MFDFLKRLGNPKAPPENAKISEVSSTSPLPEAKQIEHNQTPGEDLRAASTAAPAVQAAQAFRSYPATTSPTAVADETPHISARLRFEETAKREDLITGYSIKRLDYQPGLSGVPVYVFVIKFTAQYSVRNTFRVHQDLRETHNNLNPSGILIHIYDANDLQLRVSDVAWYLRVFADAVRGENPLTSAKVTGKRIYILRPGGRREDSVIEMIRHQTTSSLGAVSTISSASVDEVLMSIEQYIKSTRKQSARPN